MNLRNLSINRLSNEAVLRTMAIIALIGVADTIYLTANHFFGEEVKCLILDGCEVVLTSQYSEILGIPLAVLGLIFYAGVFVLVNIFDIYQERWILKLLVAGGTVGFLASLIFLYIQLFVLTALCFYCLVSFGSSTVLFVLNMLLYKRNIN